MGEFFLDICSGLASISKKTILAGGNYGGFFFLEIWSGCSRISKKQYWRIRRKGIIGKIVKKFGEGLCGFPKNNIGARKLWRKKSRSLEKNCMDL